MIITNENLQTDRKRENRKDSAPLLMNVINKLINKYLKSFKIEIQLEINIPYEM